MVVGAPVTQVTKYPCPDASKDHRGGSCHPPNSFEHRLLCKAQNIYLRGRCENPMWKTVLRSWALTSVGQLQLGLRKRDKPQPAN